MNELLNYGPKGGMLCKIFDAIILANNGAFSSFTNFNGKTIPMDIKRHHFSGYYKTKCSKAKYNQIVDKIKQLDIFANRVNEPDFKTVVHKPAKYISEDDLIGISISFISDSFFITSYEKISILDETDNSFIVCISTCNQNIINGYYTVKLKYDNITQTIYMKYIKVQVANSFGIYLLEILTSPLYVDAMTKSVVDTFNYLFQDEVMTIKDVLYSYK